MRHAAFLRAINVGGRIVKMSELAAVFSETGLTEVETFLASGNVLFNCEPDQSEGLHDLLEDRFKSVFGYMSEVFIRSAHEMRAIASRNPFPETAVSQALTNCVGFIRVPLPSNSVDVLQALGSNADQFHVEGREIYWLSANSQATPSFSLKQMEKAIGMSATFRGVNTVRRIAAKCS